MWEEGWRDLCALIKMSGKDQEKKTSGGAHHEHEDQDDSDDESNAYPSAAAVCRRQGDYFVNRRYKSHAFRELMNDGMAVGGIMG